MCIFESDTVKSDCPVQIFRKNDKIFKNLLHTVGLPYQFLLEILKKKKKSSENDQLTGHFQRFLIYFFVPPTLNLKKNPHKSTNKKIRA